MRELESKLAVFYNFKDQQTCPFCRLATKVFDAGGKILVQQTLGFEMDERYRHSSLICFIHYYFIAEIYMPEKKQRQADVIIREAYNLFKHISSVFAFE